MTSCCIWLCLRYNSNVNQYLAVIEQAAVIFPLVAFVITLPYLIYNYRKYGSVMGLRVPIIYSFILYLICCYFLVILPLPSHDYVAQMTGPTTQLIPFTFVSDIAREANLARAGGLDDVLRSIFLNRAFYQVIMNVAMFAPLGVYLRYYFRCSLKRTVLISLLLSLFFELTQLSGLYFIYPRGYRLFDVDDLMMNTLGGIVGYWVAGKLARLLPSRADINQASYRRSQKVSLLRRLVAMICDLVAMVVLAGIVGVGLNILGINTPDLDALTSIGLIIVGYFGILPSFMNSQTIGQKLTRLQVARVRGGPARWYQHIGRLLSVGLVFVLIPTLLLGAIYYMMRIDYVSSEGALVLSLAVAAFYAFLILLELIRAAIRRPLFYERWTDTRVISTTAIKRVDDELGEAAQADGSQRSDRHGNEPDELSKPAKSAKSNNPDKAIANDDNS